MATKQRKEGGRLSVSSTPKKMEFRKTNDAIGLRIREGKLSLLSRKLFNVMVLNAQQSQLGLNAPIETQANKKYFWIRLSEIAKSAVYKSNDTGLLKQHLEEFQNIKLHMEDEQQWTSERLVSSVKLVNTLGLKNQGGTVWFGYTFPPEVFEMVMNPITYTRLSIKYQGMLCSGASLALYEICRRYATNPSHKTCINEYEYWYGALTGNPVTETPSPYKYFNRDLLKPAITEINAVTDIDVILIEHKKGRKIEALQFEVHMKKQATLDFPAPVINATLLEKIQSFGFNLRDASDLCATHPEEKLNQTIELVQDRMKSTHSSLDAPSAYFRWALKNADGHIVKMLVSEPSKKSKPNDLDISKITPMERFLTARAKNAVEAYKELNTTDGHTVMERFKQQPSIQRLKIQKGLDHPMVKSLFGRWYATELWGEPTAEALSDFLQQVPLGDA